MDGVNYLFKYLYLIFDANFVNPDNPDIHNQNIENMWMRVKRKLRRQFCLKFKSNAPWSQQRS
jgi:hypothetical protein